MHADVIIIGAGAAGLMAALLLAKEGKKTVVLEARSRPGGRIHTLHDDSFSQPVEGGAEFIHGGGPLTRQLLRAAGLRSYSAGGELWHSTNGQLQPQQDFIAGDDELLHQLNSLEKDCNIAHFLETHFAAPQYEPLRRTLTNYVEGYYAGDLHKASAFALREELQEAEDGDARIEGGYGRLVQYLLDQGAQHGCRYHFSTPVTTVHWQRSAVNINNWSPQAFSGARLIVTVPVGVLQANGAGSLSFSPAIDRHMAAARLLGFGSVIKVLLQFKTPFWKENSALRRLGFIFSGQSIPTWWTQYPADSNLITGWCAGPQADALRNLSHTALYDKALESLAACFGLRASELRHHVAAWQVFNWATDPYTCGGYSYLTVHSPAAIAQLTTPVASTLFFAGEGLYNHIDIGTVEAALQSGKEVAKQVLQSF